MTFCYIIPGLEVTVNNSKTKNQTKIPTTLIRPPPTPKIISFPLITAKNEK